MLTLEEQRKKIEELALKHNSTQLEKYKDSIFLPYISLPNVKGKGAMMEEFFEWYLNSNKIKTQLIKTNENYDLLIEEKIKVELKVASIGNNDMVAFNQIHYSKTRDVDKFLFIIIKPDNNLDIFLINKSDFLEGKIKLQKQHSKNQDECARLYSSYSNIIEELSEYLVKIEDLKKQLTN